MNSADEILDFAIAGEQEAISFYTDLAARTEVKWIKDLLIQFSQEEEKHKEKLLAVKRNEQFLSGENAILDLKISSYIVDVTDTSNLSLQDALIIAMKREQQAFYLYSDLAGKIADATLKALFLGLAQEEAAHKLYFEREYDDIMLQDN